MSTTATDHQLARTLLANIVERVDAALSDSATLRDLAAVGITKDAARARLVTRTFDELAAEAGVTGYAACPNGCGRLVVAGVYIDPNMGCPA